MDIKATIGQLTAERDKLDKAIQALQALETASDPAPRRPARRTTRARRTRATATSNGSTSRTSALTPAKVVSLVTADGVPASAIRQQTGGSAQAQRGAAEESAAWGSLRHMSCLGGKPMFWMSRLPSALP